MAAMSLQQEDAPNRLRMDTSFTFHLKQEGPGVPGRTGLEQQNPKGRKAGTAQAGSVRTPVEGDGGKNAAPAKRGRHAQKGQGGAVGGQRWTLQFPKVEYGNKEAGDRRDQRRSDPGRDRQKHQQASGAGEAEHDHQVQREATSERGAGGGRRGGIHSGGVPAKPGSSGDPPTSSGAAGRRSVAAGGCTVTAPDVETSRDCRGAAEGRPTPSRPRQGADEEATVACCACTDHLS